MFYFAKLVSAYHLYAHSTHGMEMIYEKNKGTINLTNHYQIKAESKTDKETVLKKFSLG
jgi:hypothetical protein